MRKLNELRARLGEVRTELQALADVDADDVTEEQEERFSELERELEGDDEVRGLLADIEHEEKRAETLRRAAEAAARNPNAGEGLHVPNVNGGRSSDDPYDVRTLSFTATGPELRARAESAIEATRMETNVSDGDLSSDDIKSNTIRLMRTVKDPQGVVARRILATGSDAYRSAFVKVAGGQPHLLDNAERAALARAQSLTNAEGGFAIPFTLDPTIIYTGDGAANPFRQVSRQESIVTDTWNGVSTAGVSGGYAAEGSEVDDDSATLAQPSIKPERWDVFVPFSFEVGQDWANLESDVRMLVNQQRDEFDVVAFTSGSGTDEPEGIITALDGGSSEVAPATAETFAVADVYGLEEALPPKYRMTGAQAAWMAALSTINTIRQFADDDGHALLERLGAGQPRELLGYALHENSAMDPASGIDDGATADNFVLILGDWVNFIIVDRVGLNFELVPHLFATANNRPSGERGFLAWGRTGSDSVNDNGFRVLNVATTA